MHVRVDEPGDEHLVVAEPHRPTADEPRADLRDPRHEPVAHADLGGRERPVDEHLLADEHEVEGVVGCRGGLGPRDVSVGHPLAHPQRLAFRVSGPVSRTCRFTSL